MDELLTLDVDFNDPWLRADGSSGLLSYEPSKLTVGQHVLAVDRYDGTLSLPCTVVSCSQYVAFLVPTILPAETSDESSL